MAMKVKQLKKILETVPDDCAVVWNNDFENVTESVNNVEYDKLTNVLMCTGILKEDCKSLAEYNLAVFGELYRQRIYKKKKNYENMQILLDSWNKQVSSNNKED